LPNSYTNASRRLNITATAEALSADGSRHVPVLSAPVDAQGHFLLYPLAASTSTTYPTTYDVVIHGAGIETIIVRGVTVTRNSSGASSSSGTTTFSASANTSLGTLVPVTADFYTVNATPGTDLPAGAVLGFYQTLPGLNEVPYLIEEAATDPVNHTLAVPLPLSSGAVESGTYSTAGTTSTAAATGQTLTLTSAGPTEGAGTYRVGASSTLQGMSPLDTPVSAPAPGTTAAVQVTPPVVPPASGAAADSLTVTLSTGSQSYSNGVLLVTSGGALIASTALDPVLAQGGSVMVSVPGGTPSAPFAAARYYLSALLWNSNDAHSLTLKSFPGAVDLSQGGAPDVQLTIN
jgi:hypothetical protein